MFLSVIKNREVGSVPRRALGAKDAITGPFLKPPLALGCIAQHLRSALLERKSSGRKRLHSLPEVPKPRKWLRWDFNPALVLGMRPLQP